VIARVNALPTTKTTKRVLEKLAVSAEDGLRRGLQAATDDPVWQAVVDEIEKVLSQQLYGWAKRGQLDLLRRTIVASVDGKKRFGQMLLNFLDSEASPKHRA